MGVLRFDEKLFFLPDRVAMPNQGADEKQGVA
jgi:hypothetical protein